MDVQDNIISSKLIKKIGPFSEHDIRIFGEFISFFGKEDLLDLIYIFKFFLSTFRFLKDEGQDLQLFQSIRNDDNKDVIIQQQEAFINKYRITRMDKLLISKIVEGVPLKCFDEEIGISESNANKKIRRLWHRLGLENREQLVFIAGWMRLINFEFDCLRNKSVK
jgi:DNA-binding CsgD family transcriptional regulator